MTRFALQVPRSGLHGGLVAPPSKSYTHRVVALAALSDGVSTISGALRSRDTNATIAACKGFGASVKGEGSTLSITGTQPKLPNDIVNVEDSGTTLRIMTSVLALAPKGFSVLTGDESIRRRPMQPLLDALKDLGVNAISARMNGCAPIIVEGGGIQGGATTIRGDVSSQFITSLLISSARARHDVSMSVSDAASRPYIDATVAVMERFGVNVKAEGHERFLIPCQQDYKSCKITVPGDFSSISFMLAAVALLGGEVTLRGLDFQLPQGDSAILAFLQKLGLNVSKQRDAVIASSKGEVLDGGTFDLGDTPDLLPVLAVAGLKCNSPLVITGVEHARFKETDRIAVLARELVKLGAKVEERKDGLTINPSAKLRPASLESHDDHRLCMAFALVSALVEGTETDGLESLDVSYPGFLDDLKKLGAKVKGGGS